MLNKILIIESYNILIAKSYDNIISYNIFM